MLPINEYQRIIYNKLLETGYKVFDEVPENESLPVIMIGDYVLAEEETKNEDYIIQQRIDLYSQYDGKKEVNEMVSSTIEKIKQASQTEVNLEYSIGNIRLLESNINRLEDGLYVANLVFQINLEG